MVLEFHNAGQIDFSEPVDLTETLRLVAAEKGVDAMESSLELLSLRAEMLQEYFSIRILNNSLLGLPLLLDGYQPALDHLPTFLWNLVTKVDEIEQ
jgi:hypothetical protein